MANSIALGPVSSYVRDRLIALLRERRVVVWYDPQRAFAGFLDGLALPHTVIVSAAGSALRARREAEATYRQLNEVAGSAAGTHLLIYVPTAFAMTPEARQQDPFAAFACCGTIFGAHEGEHLQALAVQALPDQAVAIARLFREGMPTLPLLDSLQTGSHYPLLAQALGSESAVEALSQALSDPAAATKLAAVPGATAELVRLAGAKIGLPQRDKEEWPALRTRLARYLLASELAFDLPGGLPAALTGVPQAEQPHRQDVLAICARLRETDAGRDAYIALANEAEHDLKMGVALGATPQMGTCDTFAVQDRLRLQQVVAAAIKDNLATAEALSTGVASIWRRQEDRTLLWSAVERSLSFLVIAAELEGVNLPRSARSLIDLYSGTEGLWRLDRAQRLYEHAYAQCEHDDEVEDLLVRCRATYRTVVARAQAVFQELIQVGGWPPDGIRRHTQIFDTYVAPELVERRRTAYFLVDSLRYEMGRDLVAKLADLGEVKLDPITTILPTKTAFGMAALLPGADGAFSVVEHKGGAVPAVAGAPLPGLAERQALLQTRYHDRLVDITLEDLRATSQKALAKQLGVADLLVVRTQDIDDLGEGISMHRARRAMTEVLGELRSAATRLANLGFQTLVFAADHGHMLLPEVAAGDALSTPPGEWLLKTRRSLLGRAYSNAPGVLRLPARDVGIVGAIDDYVTAAGFKTFNAGAGYFHEGLSLQECIVPVVVVRLQKAQPLSGGEQVTLTYNKDHFTTTVISLKAMLTNASLMSASVDVYIQAFDGATAKASVVGVAAECDARNPDTGEITLQAGVETAIPLVIDSDFSGSKIEVRATDPRTGAILARLPLKNGRLD
jgi:hypothetical protein